jgi:hypothetical protein
MATQTFRLSLSLAVKCVASYGATRLCAKVGYGLCVLALGVLALLAVLKECGRGSSSYVTSLVARVIATGTLIGVVGPIRHVVLHTGLVLGRTLGTEPSGRLLPSETIGVTS